MNSTRQRQPLVNETSSNSTFKIDDLVSDTYPSTGTTWMEIRMPSEVPSVLQTPAPLQQCGSQSPWHQHWLIPSFFLCSRKQHLLGHVSLWIVSWRMWSCQRCFSRKHDLPNRECSLVYTWDIICYLSLILNLFRVINQSFLRVSDK